MGTPVSQAKNWYIYIFSPRIAVTKTWQFKWHTMQQIVMFNLFPRDKKAEAWIWPLTYICGRSFLRNGGAVQLVRNVMAHAQKPNFVFPRNGRVHSNRWGRQFSRLLAAEVCASALVMLDIPRSGVAWEYWLPTPFASFPFTSPSRASPCATRFRTSSTPGTSAKPVVSKMFS